MQGLVCFSADNIYLKALFKDTGLPCNLLLEDKQSALLILQSDLHVRHKRRLEGMG